MAAAASASGHRHGATPPRRRMEAHGRVVKVATVGRERTTVHLRWPTRVSHASRRLAAVAAAQQRRKGIPSSVVDHRTLSPVTVLRRRISQ
ncbi:restriction endonuclease subunit, partial [Sesbania bispinosa]